MYFSLAKFFSPFGMPLGLGCLLLLLAFFLSWKKPGTARLLVLLALALLAGLGFSPVAGRLVRPLETAYPVPGPTTEADAAVVLAGTVDLFRSDLDRVELYDRPERIIEGTRLVKRGRARWLVISGGSGDPRLPEAVEAEHLARLARELGVNPAAIAIQGKSRTTYSDAVETAQLLRARGIDRFFLVTSGFHMPRAVGCFRKAGLEPIPYPVDFRATPPEPSIATFAPTVSSLHLSTVAIHEYVGYAVYWVLGYL